MDGKQKRDIVRFLEHYPMALYKISAMEQKIKDLDEMCFPNGIDTSKDKVKSSNTQDAVYDTAVRRERQREKYEKIKRREEAFVELHDMAFGKLSDAEQEVLRRLYHGRRYADGKIWLVSHGYAYSTIYRVKNKGLKKLYRYVFCDGEYVVLKRHREK